jgi:hypothetical protein
MTTGEAGADNARDAVGESIDENLEWVKKAAGNRYDELELNMQVPITVVTDDPDPVKVSLASRLGLEPTQLDHYPPALIGSVEAMCDTLEARRERWDASYFVIWRQSMELMAPVVARLAGT